MIWYPFVQLAMLLTLVATITGCDASYPVAPSQAAPITGVRIQYIFGTGDIILGVSGTTTTLFYAYSTDADGVYRDVTSRVAWSSSNAAVVRQLGTSPGFFQAVGGGTAQVIATYEGFSDAITVIVRPVRPPFPYLTISLDVSSLMVGATGRAQALMQVAVGSTQDVTSMAAWATSDPSIVAVSAGQVTAVAPGTVELTASFNGLTTRYGFSVRPRQQ